MAGFAINLRGLLEKSDIQVGLEPNGQPNPLGYLETRLLQKFVTRESVECRGSSKEASRKGGREREGERRRWEEEGRREKRVLREVEEVGKGEREGRRIKRKKVLPAQAVSCGGSCREAKRSREEGREEGKKHKGTKKEPKGLLQAICLYRLSENHNYIFL